MRTSSILFALLVGVGGLAACGDDAGTEAGAAPTTEPVDDNGGAADDDGADIVGPGDALLDRTFLSESVTEDGQDRPLVDGTQIRLVFDLAGSIGADAGCNHLGGTLEIEEGRLVVSGVGGTEMGCDPALHDQDDWLAGFLESGPTYVLDGDRLTLESDGVVVELVDREVADPDRSLEGTTWEVNGFVGGGGEDGTVSSGPLGEEPATLVFADGQVELTNPGCNSGSGRAEVSETDREVVVSDLILTRMGCQEPAASVEADIVAVLDRTLTYEIEAGSLTLMNDSGRGILLVARD